MATKQPSVITTFAAFMQTITTLPEGCQYSTFAPLSGWGGLPQGVANMAVGFGSFSAGMAFRNGAPMVTPGAYGNAQQSPTVSGAAFDRAGPEQMYRVQNALQGALDLAGPRDRVTEELKITEVRIMRMLPNNSGIGLDVNVSFKVNDKEFWGVFKRYGVDTLPDFVSEVNGFVRNTVAHKKLIGALRNTLAAWFSPKPGIYKVIAEAVPATTESGARVMLSKKSKIEVVQTLSEQHICRINTPAGPATISGTNYMWFNYWFEPA